LGIVPIVALKPEKIFPFDIIQSGQEKTGHFQNQRLKLVSLAAVWISANGYRFSLPN
jgi:hypothetical protein